MTGKLMRRKIRLLRVAAGAGAGALWACVSLLLAVGEGAQLAAAFGAVSILMARLAYGERRLRPLLKEAGGLCLMSVLMAGGLEFLREIRCRAAFSGKAAGLEQQNLPFFTLCFGAGAVFFFVCFLWETAGKESRLRDCRAEAVLVFKGRQVKVRAFLDTGNQLYDPVFCHPVSIIWAGAVKGFFDGTEGITMIPYRSVGREGGLLPAVRADEIQIERGGRKKTFKKPLIALSKEPLSSKGEYELLLNTEVWEQAVVSLPKRAEL